MITIKYEYECSNDVVTSTTTDAIIQNSTSSKVYSKDKIYQGPNKLNKKAQLTLG